jgi:anaerobic magnesium-protoporphyrin IX monomethyl ester cyclase
MTKKVLLIQPNYRVQRVSGAWGVTPPMGLAYLAGMLEKNNFPVEILDTNALDLTIPQTIERINQIKPDIVGVSILTPAHQYSIDIINGLPKEILKIAGGPHPSAVPEEMLRNGFDIVAKGEGEYTLLEIVQGKPFKEIKGISFIENGQIFHNSPREPLDPNDLPLPSRHLLISNAVDKPYSSGGTQYFPWARITSSRGCPYNCYYCAKQIFGHGFRARTPENVLEEIDFLVKNYKIKEVSFSDDCFNFDLNRANKILDLIIERKYNLCLRFSNGLRVDKVNESFLRKMKEAGCRYIGYGVESGNQDVINNIPKGVTLDQIREAIKLTKKVGGIFVSGYFMFGLIGDTEETMQQTIDFSKELDLDVASFTIAVPYPGTRLETMIKQKGGKIHFKSWDEFHHTAGRVMFSYPGMVAPEKIEAAYKRAIREFYFRPRYIFGHLSKYFSLHTIKVGLKGLRAVLVAVFRKT